MKSPLLPTCTVEVPGGKRSKAGHARHSEGDEVIVGGCRGNNKLEERKADVTPDRRGAGSHDKSDDCHTDLF